MCSKKDDYQKQFDEGLKELNKDINELKLNIENNNEENIKFNQKLDFLEVRLKHDLFHIVYRGFEYPPEKNYLKLDKEENSDSSDSDDDKKEKKDK